MHQVDKARLPPFAQRVGPGPHEASFSSGTADRGLYWRSLPILVQMGNYSGISTDRGLFRVVATVLRLHPHREHGHPQELAQGRAKGRSRGPLGTGTPEPWA